MSAKKSDNTVNEELQKKGLEGKLDKLQKPLTYVGVALILLVGSIYGYTEYIQKPNETKAINGIFMAQEYYENGEWEKALNGDGINFGLLAIISKYGGTNQGNLARFYAGVCYLNMGGQVDSTGVRNTNNFSEAVKHLEKFSTNSPIAGPVAYGALGDAYSELGNYASAIKSYEKAANASDNEYTAPKFLFKMGLACLETQDFGKASKAFQKVKDDYPTSEEGNKVASYLAMAQAKAGK